MKKTLGAALLSLTLFVAPAVGQENVPPAEGIERLMFPPELIMQHRRALGLSPGQREAITVALGQMQAAIVELEWELSDAAQDLEEALSMTPIDEDRAVELLTAVFEAEDAVKLTHMVGLIRIRNALTPEQLRMLGELRDREHEREPVIRTP